MKTLRLIRDVARAWLDVRFLRWANEQRPELRTFHGAKPTQPGYRRKR